MLGGGVYLQWWSPLCHRASQFSRLQMAVCKSFLAAIFALQEQVRNPNPKPDLAPFQGSLEGG